MLTPSTPSGGDVWRVLRCPHGTEIEALLTGALSVLGQDYRWEQFGSMSPTDTAQMFRDVLYSFREVQMPLIGSFINTLATLDSEFYLLCDGSEHDVSDWPELAPHIPASWVTGGTFALPNLAGVTFVGTGDVGEYSFEMGVADGEFTHTLTEGELPPHTHTYTAPMISDLDFEDVGVPQPAAGINPIPQQTGSIGSGVPHNNMPPHFPVNVYLVGKLP